MCGGWLGAGWRARDAGGGCARGGMAGRGWSHGGEVRWRFRPCRARCAGCGVTHVLLPVSVLVRRADVVAVIGAALVSAAAGWGHRRIAEWLGRPAATVRGWLRRFRARAGPLRVGFTALLCALDAEVSLPEPAGSEVADAVVAIVAAAGAVARRWAVLAVSPWQVAAAVTSGGLLDTGSIVDWPTRVAPGEAGRAWMTLGAVDRQACLRRIEGDRCRW